MLNLYFPAVKGGKLNFPLRIIIKYVTFRVKWHWVNSVPEYLVTLIREQGPASGLQPTAQPVETSLLTRRNRVGILGAVRIGL